MERKHKAKKYEHDDIRLANKSLLIGNIIHYYKWLKKKMLQDCAKSECGYGRRTMEII